MKIKYIVILILLIVLSTNKTNIKEKETIIKTPSINIVEESDEIGRLIIDKINLNRPLYNINDSRNNIEENVTILKESIMPDKDNSIVFIAAHSGTGDVTYFNDLDKLTINDEIILIYKNNKYKYIVTDITENKKNGYININKEISNQLILTTCSPNRNKYQLIINCTEKES